MKRTTMVGHGKRIVPITDPHEAIPAPLLDPHYSDRRFLRPRTIFLKEGFGLCDGQLAPHVDGAHYYYGDHLFAFTAEQIDQARESAKNSGENESSAAYREAYLRSLLDRSSLELVHIVGQINRSNGNSVLCYGYFLR